MNNIEESEEREKFRQKFKEFCEERQRQYDLENGIKKCKECAE